MSARGVTCVGVTSQPDSVAKKTIKDWGIKIPLIGNPDNKIAKGCIEEGVLPTLAITMPEDTMHPIIGVKKNYPNGCVQPGMAFVKLPMRVVFRWAVVPSMTNMGGASKRIDPIDTWNRVYSSLGDADVETPLVAVEPGKQMSCLELFCCSCCLGSKVDPKS
eukprot:TRINITY_DN20610_c0_g1_i1.p1 TRINITY_DN20610_c0_g1~~TRINITY_DN20610_c0_g1_i1.p1  ORF type:complete len:162 (+),score=22.87 TRINITY_DN20610_c0_g1_i1:178-663(+)